MNLQEANNETLRRRTFAIISHPDAGKTTLTEKVIFHGGLIRETGEVKAKAGKKTATSDWMDLEKQKGISITSSVLQFEYKGLKINLLDTPGHKDFSEDTYRVLTAVDSAVMLIDVAKGVEERTRKLYEVCQLRQIPILTFINKLDREGKAPLDLLDEVEKTLGMVCYPLTWPIGIGDRFKGIYNRMDKKVVLYDQKREDVLEFTVLEGMDLDHPLVCDHLPKEIVDQTREELELLDTALPPFSREEFLAGRLTPVTFGSAKQNFAIDIFLDFFAKYAPGPQRATTLDLKILEPTDKAFSGFVFKIQANMNKKHRDAIAFFRIQSGVFERGMKVWHPRLQREIRLNHSASFVADEKETVDHAFAGDILGLTDSGLFAIGDSLATEKGVVFPDIPRFAPELFATLRVQDSLKRVKLKGGLEQLAQEGTIQLFIDPLIGPQDYIIGVVGELQFEVLTHRLLNEYGLEVKLDRKGFTVARWPRDRSTGRSVEVLKGNLRLHKDLHGEPVLLLNQTWDLNWAQKENPDVEFVSSLQVGDKNKR